MFIYVEGLYCTNYKAVKCEKFNTHLVKFNLSTPKY